MNSLVKTVSKYLSLVKFSHTVFAMPFAIIGFALASKEETYSFSFFKLILVILCMVFARSAAMAFNRYLDCAIDAKNPRTSMREMPVGAISSSSALAFVLLNCLMFMLTCFFINPICFYLSPAALMVVLGYSYTKRFTPLCHLVLGLGLSLAPIGAYLAVSGVFHLLPILFSFIVICWVSGFDIIYALQDEEFDKRNNLNSIPVRLGKQGALYSSRLLHFFSTLFVLIAGFFGNFGIWYWVGALFFAGFLIYQQMLVKPNDLSKVNLAFFTMNGLASIVFGSLVVLDILV